VEFPAPAPRAARVAGSSGAGGPAEPFACRARPGICPAPAGVYRYLELATPRPSIRRAPGTRPRASWPPGPAGTCPSRARAPGTWRARLCLVCARHFGAPGPGRPPHSL